MFPVTGCLSVLSPSSFFFLLTKWTRLVLNVNVCIRWLARAALCLWERGEGLAKLSVMSEGGGPIQCRPLELRLWLRRVCVGSRHGTLDAEQTPDAGLHGENATKEEPVAFWVMRSGETWGWIMATCHALWMWKSKFCFTVWVYAHQRVVVFLVFFFKHTETVYTHIFFWSSIFSFWSSDFFFWCRMWRTRELPTERGEREADILQMFQYSTSLKGKKFPPAYVRMSEAHRPSKIVCIWCEPSLTLPPPWTYS